jgi:hypothetical protein
MSLSAGMCVFAQGYPFGAIGLDLRRQVYGRSDTLVSWTVCPCLYIAMNLHVFPSVWGRASSRDSILQAGLNIPGVLIRLGAKQRRWGYNCGLNEG